MEFSLRLPVMSLSPGAPLGPAETALKAHLEALSQQIKTDALSRKDEVSTFASKAKGAGVQPYEYRFDFQMGHNRDGLLSIWTQESDYTGGAHPMTRRKSYTVDLTSGKVLKLRDLFSPGADFTSIINTVVSANIALDPERYFQDDVFKFRSIKPDQFYVRDGRLMVYFQLYEIAPYFAGILEFPIDGDKIESILLDAYKPAIDGGIRH